MAFARFIDKVAAAMLHFLFHHATPADAMIGQLAVPLVVVERDFAFFQILLRTSPSLQASLPSSSSNSPSAFGVPGIEQFARVAPLRLSIGLTLRSSSLGHPARVFLIQLVGNFDLLLRIFQRDRLKQRVDTARRHQSVGDRCV